MKSPLPKTFLVGVAMLVALLLGAMVVRYSPARPAGVAMTPPTPPAATDFTALGKAYVPQLGTAYGRAWNVGAASLDAGNSIKASLEAVTRSWQEERSAIFDQSLGPAFAAIVAPSTPDAQVTPAQRAAMAAAWRTLAKGMSP